MTTPNDTAYALSIIDECFDKIVEAKGLLVKAAEDSDDLRTKMANSIRAEQAKEISRRIGILIEDMVKD